MLAFRFKKGPLTLVRFLFLYLNIHEVRIRCGFCNDYLDNMILTLLWLPTFTSCKKNSCTVNRIRRKSTSQFRQPLNINELLSANQEGQIIWQLVLMKKLYRNIPPKVQNFIKMASNYILFEEHYSIVPVGNENGQWE